MARMYVLARIPNTNLYVSFVFVFIPVLVILPPVIMNLMNFERYFDMFSFFTAVVGFVLVGTPMFMRSVFEKLSCPVLVPL